MRAIVTVRTTIGCTGCRGSLGSKVGLVWLRCVLVCQFRTNYTPFRIILARTDLIDFLQIQCDLTERILRDVKRDSDQGVLNDMSYDMDPNEVKRVSGSPQALA